MAMVRTLPRTPWKNLVATKIRADVQRAAEAVRVREYGWTHGPKVAS